ncbi:MAG TPA: 2-succinyl-5-enolpyruvyl-6-hydroxy-3-cyclohexene-1-carboxylic-acid synthase [Kiritimatiellia bacterium]|nr:2-succinyl-5-enolpyruvyl-6-hydroxy-3-cyclohexene-1-carboxylic-acid synthase [Kiritimatiellia bacterium]
MKPRPPNLNCAWAELLVEELARSGVRAIGVAPGSRSSPLAEAAAAQKQMDLVVHPDERGLAFHLLGRAKASRRPAAVVTTSGTAAANLFPAVAEAHHAGIPLIVITADRPHELRDCGANQATDQTKLFGTFVRRFIELPPPDPAIAPGFLLAAVDDAVHAARLEVPGPVHLNVLFREPLAPTPVPYSWRAMQRELGAWLTHKRPWVDHAQVETNPLRDDTLLNALGAASRGIILAGAMNEEDAAAAVTLAERMGWPLLPDLQSGLRLGSDSPAVVPHADLLLCSERFRATCKGALLLQLGSGFVTRRFLDFAGSPDFSARILVDPAPGRVDPRHRASHRVMARVGPWIRSVLPHLPPRSAGTFPTEWREASQRVERALEKRFSSDAMSEPAIAWTLSRLLKEDHACFIGNSLPIRMAATFASASGVASPVYANRGLSGIDGQLATAAGCAVGAGVPLTALVGDLTFLHDLNSLALLRQLRVPVIIVLINNDGGGIFSLLPIADSARHFERVFGTPHGLGFKSAANLFGLSYAAPRTLSALERAWRAAARSGRSCLIEMRTTRAATAREVRAIQSAIARMLDA